MIKIIKQEDKEFYMTCPRCNCKYSYELEDLTERYLNDGTYCPCCDRFNLHHVDNTSEVK